MRKFSSKNMHAFLIRFGGIKLKEIINATNDTISIQKYLIKLEGEDDVSFLLTPQI